jgi:hypothetical protein
MECFCNKLDGVAKIPISCVVAHPKGSVQSSLEEGTSFGAHFCSFGIPCVWPQSQKYTTPGVSNFLLSHPETFCEFVKLDGVAKSKKTLRKAQGGRNNLLI